MNETIFNICKTLIDSSYVEQSRQARRTRETQVHHLLEQVGMFSLIFTL